MSGTVTHEAREIAISSPETHRASLVSRHPVEAYYALTLLFSWAVELPLVAAQQGWITTPIPFSIHYLASFGPTLAALVVTALISGRGGLAELWSRIVKWRVGWVWAAFAIGSPLAFVIVGVLVTAIARGSWPDLRLFGQVNYLPYLGWWVLPMWLITFGFGEEIGWRGFALPRLQKGMSAARATLILGLLWTGWHVPAFFYLDTYQNMPWIVLPGLVFGILCGAVLLTWLYNGSGGSVLMVSLWHGLFDLVTASKAGQDVIPIVATAGVIVWALIVANVNKPWGLRFQEKQVL
jgi:membrane protease YdiL (CAAX protease family)